MPDSVYPTSLDTFVDPVSANGDTLASVPHDLQHRKANDALLAIETKLGTGSGAAVRAGDSAGGDLGGTYVNPTVTATHLASPLPLAQGGTANTTGQPSGTAGGDLSGTYPNPTVAKVNGVAAASIALVQENTDTVTLTAGGTQVIPDVTTDTIHAYTFGAGNVTFQFPTAAAGKSFLLALKQDSVGSRTATWPSSASVRWPGGTAPTLTTTASKTDYISFVCTDGTHWDGIVAGLNF